MLTIRLTRVGGKKKPYYRVVVLEKGAARDGRSLEILGQYNPVPNPAQIELNRERIQYWVGKGAQVSHTVEQLLRRAEQRSTSATGVSPAAGA